MGRSGSESAARLVVDAAARRIDDTSLSLRFQCWVVWTNSIRFDDDDGRTTVMIISSINSSVSIRTRAPNASRKHQSHSRLVLVRKKLRAVGTVSCSQSRRRASRIALTDGGGSTRELPTTTEDRRIDKVVASPFLPIPYTHTHTVTEPTVWCCDILSLKLGSQIMQVCRAYLPIYRLVPNEFQNDCYTRTYRNMLCSVIRRM
jgi:hypothetical protein